MAGTSLTFQSSGLDPVQRLVIDMQAAGRDTEPLMLAIAQTMMQSTQRRFDAQRAPSGAPWTPSKAALKEGRKTLIKTRRFRDETFSAEATENTATWGTSFVAGRLFQLGGTIHRKARDGSVRLRQNRDGSLMRQAKEGPLSRLARFAKASHKLAKAVDFTAPAYDIKITARPFLGLDARDIFDIENLAVDHYLRRPMQGVLQ